MDLIRVFLDIGNILRLKLGSNKKYKIEEMADAISSIQYHNINGIKKIYEHRKSKNNRWNSSDIWR